MIRFRNALIPFVATSVFALAACGGNKDNADDLPADVVAAEDAAAIMETAPAETFVVTLSGAAERPTPVETKAEAEATIMVYADSIAYVVNGLNVMGVTAVHVHKGGAEEAGDVMATLYTSEAGNDFASGPMAMGTITRETPLAEGATFDALRELVRTGAAYINVHTKANPKGELRAQTAGNAM